MTKRHRSAVDGKYVTAKQAKADPERTVSEAIGREVGERWADFFRQLKEADERKAEAWSALLARIEALEAAVAELQAKR